MYVKVIVWCIALWPLEYDLVVGRDVLHVAGRLTEMSCHARAQIMSDSGYRM